jgi:hypothetical protein
VAREPLAQQVVRREPVGVVAAARDEHPVPGQLVGVRVEGGLDRGRPGLGEPDVEVDVSHR